MTLAIPLYLHLLSISISLIGVIYVGIMVFMVLTSLLFGMIGDRLGYKKSLILSEIPPILGGLLLWFSGNMALTVIAAIVSGVGGVAGGLRGSFSPGTTAIVVSNYPEDKERVMRISSLTKVASAFSIIGAFVLMSQSYLQNYLGPISSYRFLFLISSFLMALSLINLLFVFEAKRPKKTTKIMKMSSMLHTMKVIATNVVNGAGIGIAMPLFPLILESAFKIPSQSTSLIIGLVYIPSYIGVSFGSYLAGRFSYKKNIVLIASATRAVSGLILVFMGVFIAFQYFGIYAGYSMLVAVTLLYAARSIIAGYGNPFIQAVNMKGINKEDYGTASSFQGVASTLSMSSSGISGYLIEEMLPLPLLLGGILQAVSGALYLPLFKKKYGNAESVKIGEPPK